MRTFDKTVASAGGQLLQAYVHLMSGRHTTATLAEALGVSPATAFRLIKTLRGKGLPIVSMKEGKRWFFAVQAEDDQTFERDPLVRARGMIRGIRWPRGKSLNEAIDDELYGKP